MAQTIPINFPIPPEPAVVQYNFTDVSRGIATKTYYVVRSQDSQDLIITDYQLDSDPDLGSLSSYKTADLSEFQVQTTVKGDAIFEFTLSSISSNGITTVQVRKWDGASETNISSEVASSSAGSGTYILTVPLTRTKFKPGEKLRIAFKCAATGAKIDFTSPFRVYIPYELKV